MTIVMKWMAALQRTGMLLNNRVKCRKAQCSVNTEPWYPVRCSPFQRD